MAAAIRVAILTLRMACRSMALSFARPASACEDTQTPSRRPARDEAVRFVGIWFSGHYVRRGNVKEKVAPRPGSLRAVISP